MSGGLRRLAERLARGRSLTRRISVGGQRVPLVVSPDAQLKYLKPGLEAFDLDLIAIAETCVRPGDTVWDVGANVGVFTVAAAVAARTVWAIEADIWLAGLLRRTAALPANADRDIHVLPTALSDKVGTASFDIAARGRASNALSASGGRSQMGGARDTVTVPTLTLDTLLDDKGPPDFIKIDVEGAEELVLAGGARVLQEARPLVYIEVGEDQRTAIAGLFAGYGYRPFDATGQAVVAASMSGENFFFALEGDDPRLAALRDRAA